MLFAIAVMLAILVFVFTYVAMTIGRVPGLRSDRLAATVVGAAAVLAFRLLSLEEAQAAVDGPTIALLFGMMVLAAALDRSGAFAAAAGWAVRRAKRPFALLVGISVASGLLSAFLINDVVCVAFTPLVLEMADRLKRDPRPYLLALATSSNAGSVATMTGNPQNILIGSISHISYFRFACVLAPVAAASVAVAIGVIWVAYRDALGGALSPRADGARRSVHVPWATKTVLVTAGVIVAFVAGVPPVLAALVGASVVLLTRAVDPRRLYARVDWALLALFVGLFIVVAAANRAGLSDGLLMVLSPLRLETVTGLTVVSAIVSNVVSNVPAVMLLKSTVPHLPNPESGWLTLAMASTLAGNLTLPGSLATVIVVERAKGRATVSFVDFLKVGLPIGMISLGLGVVWLSFVR